MAADCGHAEPGFILDTVDARRQGRHSAEVLGDLLDVLCSYPWGTDEDDLLEHTLTENGDPEGEQPLAGERDVRDPDSLPDPYDPEDAWYWQGDYDQGDDYDDNDRQPFSLPQIDEPPSLGDEFENDQ